MNPSDRRYPWRPDVAVLFAGRMAGYGPLAAQLVSIERTLERLGPTWEFRCHRIGRRIRLAGEVPLAATAALRDLARVGQALGMRVVCTVSLPDQAWSQPDFLAFARAGGVTAMVLDLSQLPAAAAAPHRPAVKRWMDTAALLGADVEVRGPMTVVARAGVLDSPWLDRAGFVLRPGGGDTGVAGEFCTTVDGHVHPDEASWRAGKLPVARLSDPPADLVAVLVAMAGDRVELPQLDGVSS